MALLIDGPIQPNPCAEELSEDQLGELTATVTKVTCWQNIPLLTLGGDTEVFVDVQMSQAVFTVLGLPVDRVNQTLYATRLTGAEIEYVITMMPTEEIIDPDIKPKLAACELQGRKVVRLVRVNP